MKDGWSLERSPLGTTEIRGRVCLGQWSPGCRVGEYRYLLTDPLAYQAELARLREQIKAMANTQGGAVHGTTNWTVNSSRGRCRLRRAAGRERTFNL